MRRTLLFPLILPLFACDCGDGGGLHKRRPDIAVSPNPMVFDTIPRGTTAAQVLTVQNPGDFELQVSRVSVESGAAQGFSIPETPPFSVQPGESTTIEVRFTAADIANVDGVLLIESDAKDKEAVRVSLQATRRQGPVLVLCVESIDIPLGLRCGSPTTLDFGKVRLTEIREARVTLRSEGTDPVVVSGVSLSGHPSIAIEAPAVPLTLAVGEQASIPVELNASVKEAVTGTILVESNDAVSPSATVLVTGEGAELGLCVEPALVDFGAIRVGQSAEEILKLRNCGSAPIDVTGSSIFAGSDVFTVVQPIGAPITLPPQAGLSFELTLRYAPTTEREDAGKLRITTSNGDAIVELKGDTAACRLSVTPESLHFQVDPFIGGETKNLLLENSGSSVCTVDVLELTEESNLGFNFDGGIRGAGGEGGGDAPPPPPGGGRSYWNLPIIIDSGESYTVAVSFWPWDTSQSTAAGQIRIEAVEIEETFTVELSATIEFEGNCALQIRPETLSFGVMSVGQRRILGVELISDRPCQLADIAIDASSDASFTIAPPEPDVVWNSAVVFVEFAPTAPGVFGGTLLITPDGDQPVTAEVGLTGGAGDPSLCVDPRELPFGDRTTPGTMNVNITACGNEAVTVNQLGWLEADPEFSLLTPPGLPFNLAIGETRTITIQYDPQDQTGDTAILDVRSSSILAPSITVRMTGGREIVPPEAGRYLYFWQIWQQSLSDIVKMPLQGNLVPDPYIGDRAGTGCAGCHQLSPDGRYLAYTSGLSFTISIVDTETSSLAAAPGNQVEALYMSWNPEVNTNPPYQYVYSLQGDLHTGSLYTGYIGPVQGANDPNLFETMPSWGPDGQIVYTVSDQGGGIGIGGATGLYLIDEAGGVAQAVAGASNDNQASYYPRFSPNGTWIAFTKSPSASGTVSAPDASIKLVKADNSGTVLDLPQANQIASSFPTWSADGRFLSFSSNRAGGLGSWDIYIAPIDPVTGADGPAVNVIEANSSSFEHAAQWSP
jgi:hypothetical protein